MLNYKGSDAAAAVAANHRMHARDILDIARLMLCVIAVAGTVMGVNIATYAM